MVGITKLTNKERKKTDSEFQEAASKIKIQLEKDASKQEIMSKVHRLASGLENYENKSTLYDSWMSFEDKILQNDTISMLLKDVMKNMTPSSSVIADIGCGTGVITSYLAIENPDKKFYGIDYSSGMVKNANIRKNKLGINNIEFLVGDNYDIPIKDDACDFVYQTRPSEQNHKKVVEEAYRISNDKGVFTEIRQVSKYKCNKIFYGIKQANLVNIAINDGKGKFEKALSAFVKSYKHKGNEKYLVTSILQK